ncbi:hypothetical protein ABFP36_26290, partial [Salmonella enterica subsp. enterica serovar Kentucky]
GGGGGGPRVPPGGRERGEGVGRRGSRGRAGSGAPRGQPAWGAGRQKCGRGVGAGEGLGPPGDGRGGGARAG